MIYTSIAKFGQYSAFYLYYFFIILIFTNLIRTFFIGTLVLLQKNIKVPNTILKLGKIH